jgi:hypothetical protein
VIDGLFSWYASLLPDAKEQRDPYRVIAITPDQSKVFVESRWEGKEIIPDLRSSEKEKRAA